MDYIIVDLYEDVWVLTSMVEIAGGRGYHGAPPVRLIQHGEKEKLKAVLIELLNEDVPVVPPHKVKRWIGIKLKAVNARGPLAYCNRARCFQLEVEKDHLFLQELLQPLYQAYFTIQSNRGKRFPLDQVDELVEYLIKKTKSELPKKTKPKYKTKAK